MIYYTGNFEADLRRSEPIGQGSPDKGAPTYAQVLREVRDEAQRLHNLGRIRISERMKTIKPKGGTTRSQEDVRVIEYFAHGLTG